MALIHKKFILIFLIVFLFNIVLSQTVKTINESPFDNNNFRYNCYYDETTNRMVTELANMKDVSKLQEASFTVDYAMFNPTVIMTDGSQNTTLLVKLTNFSTVSQVTASGSILTVGGNQVPEFTLYDDGTNGDLIANDGIYTRDNISTLPWYSGNTVAIIKVRETDGTETTFNSSPLYLHTTSISIPSINKVNEEIQYSEHVVNIKDYGDLLLSQSPQQVTVKFFDWISDVYDFITIFPQPWPNNFPSNIYGINYAVKNDVSGLGLNIFDNTSDFGSNNGILQSVSMCRNFQVDLHEKLHQSQVWLDPSLNLDDGSPHWNLYANFVGFLNMGSGGLYYRKVNNGTFVRQRHDGIYKSSDGGNNWVEKNMGMWARPWREDLKVSFIKVNPQPTNEIFAGTAGGGMYKSMDNGETWFEINIGIPGGNYSNSRFMHDIAFDPLNSSVIYTVSTKVFESNDSGDNWQILYDAGVFTLNVFAIDPISSNILYTVQDRSFYIIKSTDGGVTWNLLNVGQLIEPKALKIDPNNTQTLYLATKNVGILRSLDGGVNWHSINNGLLTDTVRSLQFHPSDPQILLAGTEKGIFRSDNGGDLWYELNGNIDKISSLVIDSQDPQIIYAGSGTEWSGSGSKAANAWGNLYKSIDGGLTFNPVNIGLTNPDISSICIHPTNSNIIFSATVEPLTYSPLELYLMGLIPPSQVPPILVTENPQPDPWGLNGGETFTSSNYYEININDIINIEGPRVPDYQTSQKDWNIAHVVVSRDRLLSQNEMAFFNEIGRYYGSDETVNLNFNELKSIEAASGYRLSVESNIIANSQPIFQEANINVLLEGPYTSGAMTTNLQNQNLIPLSQPYGNAPWNHDGTESVNNIPQNITDWVLIELRYESFSNSKVFGRAAFIKNDGQIVDLDGVSPLRFDVSNGDYYIVVYHRNHLSIMSASKVTFNSGNTVNYDFTTDLNKYYGTDAKLMDNGKYGMYAADVNNNGIISLASELTQIRIDNLQAGYYDSDVNLDGIVSLASELTKVRSNNLRGTNVP